MQYFTPLALNLTLQSHTCAMSYDNMATGVYWNRAVQVYDPIDVYSYIYLGL